MNEAGNEIEIIFRSFDQTYEEFKDYIKILPWIAFPYNGPRIKVKYREVRSQ